MNEITRVTSRDRLRAFPDRRHTTMSARNRQAAGGQVIPRKGDLDYPLWLAAVDIAIHAPWKGGKNVYAAQIPWGDINELRRVLESLGVDWREGKRTDDTQRARIAASQPPEQSPG